MDREGYIPPMVEKYAVLDMIDEAFDETLGLIVNGEMTATEAVHVVIFLNDLKDRVNELTVHIDLSLDLFHKDGRVEKLV